MSATTVFPWALAVTVLCVGAGGSQELYPGRPRMDLTAPPAAAPAEPVPPPTPVPAPAPPALSSWITGAYRCDCCGPFGGDGSIYTELYLRSGPAFVFGSTDLAERLNTGWAVQGGGRSLFFNPFKDAAWSIDLHLGFTYNNGQKSEPLSFFERPVTIRDLRRTSVNLALGREWFLIGPADAPGTKWRAGFDVGGQYGTVRADLNDPQGSGYKRRTDVFHGIVVGAHTGLEIPCGACTYFAGLRLEWDYNWIELLPGLPGNDTDLQDLNLLLVAGVRF
jgi:hypothetical protein